MRIIRIFSAILAVFVGLIPAFLLFWGSGWILGDIRVSAETISIGTPTDPFIIRFSAPVDRTSLEGRISVEPNIPVLIGWDTDGTRLSIKPTHKWREGEHYRIFIGEGKANLGRSVGLASFSFTVPGYPEIVSISPENGAKDVLLGIEDPISIRFDRSVKNFYIDFRLSPELPVVYENDVEKTEFKLLPRESLQSGTEYELSIYAKWNGEDDTRYVRIGETKFTTLPERPKEWNRDLALRLEEAKRFTKPLVTSGKYIDINIAAQVMTIFENGKLLDAYLVSSGLRGMDTPKGEYRIHNKARRPWSRKYELFMPYWMAITSDGKYGIHELPEWPSGYKEGANHLGIPVSHGCVRLGIGPAERVWNWADIGTPVVVH